jgi:hypothetical protein
MHNNKCINNKKNLAYKDPIKDEEDISLTQQKKLIRENLKQYGYTPTTHLCNSLSIIILS